MSEPGPAAGAELDTIMARRALRASRRRWRIIAIVALVIAAIALLVRTFGVFGTEETRPHLALVQINGPILPSAERRRTLEKLAENENVSAVLVEIDSPGGATAGGEELFEGLSKIRATKPVVAIINQQGASAAYMTAIAGERIWARRLSVVGSIGVLFAHVDASKLLDTIGVDYDKVATGPLKAEPDPDEPMSPLVRQSLQTLVNDSLDWFVDIVGERREMTEPEVRALADGRIMTGRMALEAGLIDAIGGRPDAIAWLEAERDIAEDLEVHGYYPPPSNDLDLLRRWAGDAAAGLFGLPIAPLAPLDGLVSVWQP